MVDRDLRLRPPDQHLRRLFHFTWVSVAVTLAGVAAIPLLLMLLFRVVPLLSIAEVQALTEDPTRHSRSPSRTRDHTGMRLGPREW